MGVLLPWNRKNEATEEIAHSRGQAIRRRPSTSIIVALSILVIVICLFTMRNLPGEVIWEVSSGEVLAFSNGFTALEVEGEKIVIDAEGNSTALRKTGEMLVLGSGGPLLFHPALPDERLTGLLEGDMVLTQRGAGAGVFGERWEVSAYKRGTRLWTTGVPGATYSACRSSAGVVLAVTDLSAGGSPSLILLRDDNGEIHWTKSLGHGMWRALGILQDGTVVAALTSGITAFLPDGTVAWTFASDSSVIAAMVADDTVCVCARAKQNLISIVYPFEMVALSSDGSVQWSSRISREPLELQIFAEKEAVLVTAEKYVVGFRLNDGDRVLSGRVQGQPLRLYSDRLLLRSRNGIQLIRLTPLGLGVHSGPG